VKRATMLVDRYANIGGCANASDADEEVLGG